jgi:hypothetical protein
VALVEDYKADFLSHFDEGDNSPYVEALGSFGLMTQAVVEDLRRRVKKGDLVAAVALLRNEWDHDVCRKLLRDALGDDSTFYRAVEALRAHPPTASLFVPELRAALKRAPLDIDRNANRIKIVQVLVRTDDREAAAEAVAALLKELETLPSRSAWAWKREFLELFAEAGPAARAALPVVLEAQCEFSSDIRFAARHALRRIDPKAAAQLLGK